VKPDATESNRILHLASLLDQPDGAQKPVQRPAFAPPLAVRPTRFSVTEIEKLIRNPYAIYARKILKLEPLMPFAEPPGPALRGQIFHQAIGEWNKAQAPGLEALLAEGQKALAAVGDEARERKFWWPHFRRLAQFLVGLEQEDFASKLKIHAEVSGRHGFTVEGVDHMLTARADRIDVLENGRFRVIDYKTGTIPSQPQVKSGLSPQLTLETFLLSVAGFPLASNRVDAALYVGIAGGRQGMKVKSALKDGEDLNAIAQAHFNNLRRLLGFYRNPAQTYLPRLREFSDEDEAEYDHLSRYLEWQLAGDRS
jgi:ATP-dependent helicase/nuclease subunit B